MEDDLAGAELDRLAEALTEIAQQARKHVTNGDVLALHDQLERVRRAGDRARGPHLAMLEVAEAFLRALARADLGKSELALRRLFATHPEIAEPIFVRLVSPSSIAADNLYEQAGAARPMVDELIQLGVLRQTGRRVDLRPALLPLARDLTEPAVLRMWRTVETARGQIALSRMQSEPAAACLSGYLGIAPQQAAAHLRNHPLRQLTTVSPSLENRPPHGGVVASKARVLYRRVSTADPPASGVEAAFADVVAAGMQGMRGVGDEPAMVSVTSSAGTARELGHSKVMFRGGLN